MKQQEHGTNEAAPNQKRFKVASGLLAVLLFFHVVDPVHRYLLSSTAESSVITFFLSFQSKSKITQSTNKTAAQQNQSKPKQS